MKTEEYVEWKEALRAAYDSLGLYCHIVEDIFYDNPRSECLGQGLDLRKIFFGA